ncbi:MAG: hypothetical protein KA313_05995, partial [Pseudarcicella sp.]|nr:hypothetical protein [Pseudarcicella sp.]
MQKSTFTDRTVVFEEIDESLYHQKTFGFDSSMCLKINKVCNHSHISNSKKLFSTFFLISFFIGIVLQQSHAQTKYTYAIGQILDAMPGGLLLPDGTRAFAKKVGLGDAALDPALGHAPLSGQWNNPLAPFGGANYTGTALPGYDSSYYASGTVEEKLFTRVAFNPSTVVNGNTLAYRNAIGYRIWFSRAMSIDQFLFLDIDGGGVGSREWLTAFGYSVNTRIMPSSTSIYTGSTPAPEVIIRSDTAVNASWNTLIDNEIGVAADNFNTTGTNTGLKIIKNIIFGGTNNPSDLQNQALFSFNSPMTDFFVLTGNQGNPNTTVPQNSGISPLSFTVYFDGGDAPSTYLTTATEGGPTHGIANYVPASNTSTLSIGPKISSDPNINGTPDTFDDGFPSG